MIRFEGEGVGLSTCLNCCRTPLKLAGSGECSSVSAWLSDICSATWSANRSCQAVLRIEDQAQSSLKI